MPEDTIAAIATAPGQGGIGIIRLSGPQSLDIAGALFRRRQSSQSTGQADSYQKGLSSHRMYLGHFIHPKEKTVVDEVLLVAMMAPNSYTREDVVEFHCHGGDLVQKKILDAVLLQGARLAEPGEFTKRAFINGRIDLSQAEAVADLINAGSDQALSSAIKNLDGKFKDRINGFVETLTTYLALLEADIEFPGEIEDPVDLDLISAGLKETILAPLEKMIADSEEGMPYVHGFFMDIVGRPNVGKSSLLNKLLGKERAIVSTVPGTTRDLVEGTMHLQGIPIHITDTAGIHLTKDPVELIGIHKAQHHLEEADLVLFVVEANDLENPKDRHVLEKIGRKSTLLVVNKIDLTRDMSMAALPVYLGEFETVFVSALHETGLQDLKQVIAGRFRRRSLFEDDNMIIANYRQKDALTRGHRSLQRANESLANMLGEDMVAADIKEAIDQLKRITGENVDADIMDQVFQRFCIGK
ncbi:MAG: tRNA uridine-5-carboxymethylaminomethyl(34) synthesis GTPase MnmE [Desulfosarcinaceae bacterium]